MYGESRESKYILRELERKQVLLLLYLLVAASTSPFACAHRQSI
jgi:hypothetical protein